MVVLEPSTHAVLMDGIYRRQRHIYDVTRKYYLLGRDHMLAGLSAPPGSAVLELGCGTGRNIILAARRYPEASFFGLDISSEMLATARSAITREGLEGRVMLGQGDATGFDAKALFGQAGFDRIFISYALSMIPRWEEAVAASFAALSPGGTLHVVDFGQQAHLPSWFRSALRAWLAKFHVEPRETLRAVIEREAKSTGGEVRFESLYRDYAWLMFARKGPRGA
jgi:S-adenosylmethionine-diacylgycerolhomoserine-N-methlytransferase